MEYNERPYFKNLDILRFFAASFVVLGHCVTDGLSYLNAPYPINNILKFITSGGHWVSLFFVLSGFLIGYLSIYDRMVSKFSFRNFFARRILRIWPLYYLMLTIGYFLIPLLAKLIAGKVFVYDTLWQFMLFIGNFATMKMWATGDFSLIPVNSSILWSVSIEEQFYLLLALIIAFVPQKHFRPIFMVLALIGLTFILYNSPSKIGGHTAHTFYYLLDFFIGALVGYGFAVNNKLGEVLKANTKWLRIALLVFLMVIIVAYPWLNIKIVLVIFFAMLIAYFVTANDSFNQWLSKQKIMLWGGKISYGIYVIHPLFQYGSYKLLGTYFFANPILINDLLCLVITSILTFIMAHLSFKYFESFFLKLKERFY